LKEYAIFIFFKIIYTLNFTLSKFAIVQDHETLQPNMSIYACTKKDAQKKYKFSIG